MPTPQEKASAVNLIAAVSNEQIGLVAALLAHGAHADIPGDDGVYALGLATFRGRLDIVKLLLANGAGVNSRHPKGCSALYTAITSGSVPILRELLAAGANPNKNMRSSDFSTALHWATRPAKGRPRNITIMKELIKAGARLDGKDKDGYTPIHYAADRGYLREAQELVRAGSDHTWLSDARQTPLFLACLSGHADVLKFLLEVCKSDPGAADVDGMTPLASAAQHGHYEAVDLLLKFEISKLGRNAYRDALCGVAMCGNVRMTRKLVRAEGGVHVKGAKTTAKMTALHYSAGYCHPWVTHVLLAAGGDERAVDRDGRTPLDVVDTMRSPQVSHGVGRRRVRRLLLQGPAYRAFSWSFPVTAESAVGVPATHPEAHHALALVDRASAGGGADDGGVGGGGGGSADENYAVGARADRRAEPRPGGCWMVPSLRVLRVANRRRCGVYLAASTRYARKSGRP